MVQKVFSLIMIISLTFAVENRSDDLAYQLVLEKINKKVIGAKKRSKMYTSFYNSKKLSNILNENKQ